MFLTLVFLLLAIKIVFGVYTKHDVVVILGSSDERILKERIDAAIQYIQKTDAPVILYVSGGVKNAFSNDVSEASKAAKQINEQKFENIRLVLDELATNTAENFAYLKRWVSSNFSEEETPEFVITTSDFHQNRAELIFHGILPEITPKWNLSKSSCISCWSDENIHIKNVKADVMKALLLM